MYKILLIGLISLHKCVNGNIHVLPIKNLLMQYPEISYQKCFNAFPFSYEPFPLSINQDNHPACGSFTETFIITIPQAYVHSRYGFVTIDNIFMQELIWKNMWLHLRLVKTTEECQCINKPGKIAVISQLCFFNYFHWITEVLCRLALLELYNIEYDWLYVNQISKFMIDSLQLWGIDPSKIIAPEYDNVAIKADQIIAPSLVSSNNLGCKLFSCYVQPHLLEYVRTKLLHAALLKKTSVELNKKIFISRKDAPQRFIENEDEVFALLQEVGFVRYELSTLSMIDQIHLFHNADIVISAQGTSLTNSIFCKPRTKVVELFQALNDATFFYLAQDLNLDYIPIKTTEFIADWYKAIKTNTSIPLEIIQDVINKYIN